jgi:putative protease
MTELLSPAGSREALQAAVQAGADAVYMGFGAFNARRNAKNFTDEEFSAAVSYCHLRGVRVYLTLNTLLHDRELDEAAALLRRASEMGVDAVLVQDWGVLALARAVAPDLPLHASTQMSLHTLGGARLAHELGMERVVLARELSREDIRTICDGCDAEIEVFVHGALCMCYSGQCAMSALIGKRSGNRGTCAQPCRMVYGINSPAAGAHPLSLKDANLSAYLTELSDMGVACLKVEGRMKRPEYVAVVTGIYRRLLDERRRPTREESRQLEAAFSRSGFTNWYYLGKKGPGMFGTRPENARWPEDLFAQARAVYEKEPRTVPVALTCRIRAGEPACLRATVRRNGRTVSAEAVGPVPEQALHRALTEEELRTRLSKTGGTAFAVTDWEVTLDEGLMLRAGDINALRREALSRLEQELTAPPARRTNPTPALPPCPPEVQEPPRLTCSIARPEQLTEALVAAGPEMIYLPLELLEGLDLTPYRGRTRFCAVLPRIFRTEDEAAFRAALERAEGLDAVAVGNLGHLPIVRGLGLELRGDFGLNVTNSRALLFLRELGLDAATVSFELRHQQVRDLKKYLPCEAIVYGRLPLMLTENDLLPGGEKPLGQADTLCDRTGARFPMLSAYGGRTEIQNSRVLYLADRPEYRACGLAWGRLRFTTETPEQCVRVLRRYRSGGGELPPDGTRGLFYRGVD